MRGPRVVLHRWAVRLSARERATELLAELDDEYASRPHQLSARNRAWYRAECRSLAYAYGAARLRRLLPIHAEHPPYRERSVNLLRELGSDLRFAFRLLRVRPTSSAVVVATVAIGIGLSVTMASVVDRVLVAPLDLLEPERVVRVWAQRTEVGPTRLPATISDFLDMQDVVPSLATAAAISQVRAGLADPLGYPTNAVVGRFAGELTTTAGLRPVHGRVFTAEEQREGAAVVMLAHHYWLQRYGGDEHVTGTVVQLDEVAHEVIGVMPAAWDYPWGVDVWRPFSSAEIGYRDDDRELSVLGRLSADGTVVSLNTELRNLSAEAAATRPEENEGIELWAEPLGEALARPIRTPLIMLLFAVGIVLAVTCSNTAALLLARGSQRAEEMSVRAALGAGRLRLIRQSLVESMVLAALAGVLALGVTNLALRAVAALAPPELPLPGGLAVDLRVLGICALATALTGFVFGLVPAVRAARNAGFGLRSGRTTERSPIRSQGLLVIAQVAMAIVLTVGATSLLATSASLLAADRGLEYERVMAVGIDIPDSLEDQDPVVLYERIRTAVQAVPGVASVAYGRTQPLDPLGLNLRMFGAEGFPEVGDGPLPRAVVRTVSDDYIATAGLRITAGRGFARADSEAGVAIVTESFGRQFFGNPRPVGATFRMPWREPDATVEVIGVVADVVAQIGVEPVPALYLPFGQLPSHGGQIIVRAESDATEPMAGVRQAIWGVDEHLTLDRAVTMRQIMADQASSPRFQSRLLGTFAAFALGLASLGVYGVINIGVSRRQRELGIRQALGADRGYLRRHVLSESMRLVVPGVVVGLGFAYGATTWFRSLLYGVAPGDPRTMALTAAAVVVLGLIAAWLPARRATRIDPSTALRAE